MFQFNTKCYFDDKVATRLEWSSFCEEVRRAKKRERKTEFVAISLRQAQTDNWQQSIDHQILQIRFHILIATTGKTNHHNIVFFEFLFV